MIQISTMICTEPCAQWPQAGYLFPPTICWKTCIVTKLHKVQLEAVCFCQGRCTVSVVTISALWSQTLTIVTDSSGVALLLLEPCGNSSCDLLCFLKLGSETYSIWVTDKFPLESCLNMHLWMRYNVSLCQVRKLTALLCLLSWLSIGLFVSAKSAIKLLSSCAVTYFMPVDFDVHKSWQVRKMIKRSN